MNAGTPVSTGVPIRVNVTKVMINVMKLDLSQLIFFSDEYRFPPQRAQIMQTLCACV